MDDFDSTGSAGAAAARGRAHGTGWVRTLLLGSLLLAAACGEDDSGMTSTTGLGGGLTAPTTGGVTATTGTPTTTTWTPTSTTTGTPTSTTGTVATTTGTASTTTGGVATTTGTTATTTGVGGETTGATTGGTSGSCCDAGECICRGEAPKALVDTEGPYAVESYDLTSAGCIYYPTDAEPPFAAVAVSDGFLGSGGCSPAAQTGGWGPFYASHGIVAMIVHTTGADQPPTRGDKLLNGIEGFKAENENPDSPLFGKLAGRYGTSGFSMGGGGTTHATTDDSSLLSSVALMPWQPVGDGIAVPTLFLCDPVADPLAACPGHSNPAYESVPAATDKMIVEFSSGHDGQPTAAGGMSGAIALAFQKVFLEGDARWRSVLLGADYRETTIK